MTLDTWLESNGGVAHLDAARRPPVGSGLANVHRPRVGPPAGRPRYKPLPGDRGPIQGCFRGTAREQIAQDNSGVISRSLAGRGKTLVLSCSLG